MKTKTIGGIFLASLLGVFISVQGIRKYNKEIRNSEEQYEAFTASHPNYFGNVDGLEETISGLKKIDWAYRSVPDSLIENTLNSYQQVSNPNGEVLGFISGLRDTTTSDSLTGIISNLQEEYEEKIDNPLFEQRKEFEYITPRTLYSVIGSALGVVASTSTLFISGPTLISRAIKRRRAERARTSFFKV